MTAVVKSIVAGELISGVRSQPHALAFRELSGQADIGAGPGRTSRGAVSVRPATGTATLRQVNTVWIPEDLDLRTANVARMYDYFLGGGHNLEVDRIAARRAIEIMPHIVVAARANRAFLQRAVGACLDQGIRQFLDLGSGIPTVGPVHQIAHRIDPAARVAYVDTDPVAVAHTELLLADVPAATITRADLTNPADVLTAPGVAGLLDFDQPIAVIVAAVLHFVPDDRDPRRILRIYRDAIAPGSLLVFSHGAIDDDEPDCMAAIREHYRNTSHPVQRRTHAQIEALLDGWHPLQPGLVDANQWRLDDPDVPDDVTMLVTLAST